MLAPGDRFAEVHDSGAALAEISLSPGDPLVEIAPGDDVVLRPYGAHGADGSARVERLRAATQTSGGEARVVAVTSPFARWIRRSRGLTGHARIYGAARSLAYAMVYLPVQR
jgi:hypothetical protein